MTRRVALILVSVMLLVMLPIAAMAGIQSNNESEVPVAQEAAEPVINCVSTRISDARLKVRCAAAGISLLNTVVDLPRVEVPVPGPTSTRTIKIDVPAPGQPTRTVTERVEIPGPIETIRQPGETRTIRPDAPTETVTRTASPDEPRQPGTKDDTMESDNDNPGVEFPNIDLDTAETVGLSIGFILAMLGLILIGAYTGFYMGRRGSEKEERTFLKSLINKD